MGYVRLRHRVKNRRGKERSYRNNSDGNKFSAKQAMKDLEFLGKMNVQLDKIVQAHATAKTYENAKEEKK